MAVAYSELIQSCDADIRAGKAHAVKLRLADLNAAQVPRPQRLPLAKLCRRVGLYETAMRLLAPLVVEGRKPQGDQPTAAELAEYAVVLQRCGVIDEALKILSGISPDSEPEVLLFQAYCHFNRWEYQESIPLLRAYVARDLPPYQKMIGNVNLAAALATTRAHGEALDLLAHLLSEAAASGNLRLQANCHEIRSQIHLVENRLEDAEDDLRAAMKILEGEGTVAELSSRKWQAVLDATRAGDTEPLKKFRAAAVEFGDWEAIRHTDLNLLKIEFDEHLFQFHMFGSPWLGYRASAQGALSRLIEVETFDFGSGGELLDMRSGHLGGVERLETGSKLHRALSALMRDFYRPVTPGTMFNNLFPGEYYDVFSSPNRVHQVLFRLRRWLDDASLPVELVHDRAGYSLRVRGPLSIRVPFVWRDPDARVELLRQLRSHPLARQAFAAADLAAALGVSTAVARRFLKWAVDLGHLEKTGAGSGTRYVLHGSRAA